MLRPIVEDWLEIFQATLNNVIFVFLQWNLLPNILKGWVMEVIPIARQFILIMEVLVEPMLGQVALTSRPSFRSATPTTLHIGTTITPGPGRAR